MRDDKRQAILRTTADLFIEFLKGRVLSSYVTKNALPRDARVVHCESRPEDGGVITLVLESQSFEPTAEGSAVPVLEDVHFGRYED